MYEFYCHLILARDAHPVINFAEGAGADFLAEKILASYQSVLEGRGDVLSRSGTLPTFRNIAGFGGSLFFFSIWK